MHVGKIAPRSLYKDIIGIHGLSYWCPRCLTIKFSNFSSGTFAVAWNNLLVTSAVQKVNAGCDEYTYTFQHPTEPTYTYDMVWTMRIRSLTTPQIPNYWTEMKSRPRISGTQIGTGQSDFVLSANWWSPDGDGFYWNIGCLGIAPYTPATLFSMNGRMRAASWAEQPNYHPYKWIGDPGEDIEGNPIVLP